ncbi:MAG: serine/threonine protein phosphatase [Deltaproteobacteria bacterium]|nr:serine/threonine protein phosphatase [Deltaproteobacteria bacterium]
MIVGPDALVVALADGAGGTGNGAAAAQAVIDAVAARQDWQALDEDPARLGHGQTTAIVLTVDANGIEGASVGDSEAWLIGDEVTELTARQVRKPLLGSGCMPVGFAAGPIGTATLLVASDGLVRYAKQQDIARIARGADLVAAARALVELVRLPSGGLQDDVAVVLVRRLR